MLLTISCIYMALLRRYRLFHLKRRLFHVLNNSDCTNNAIYIDIPTNDGPTNKCTLQTRTLDIPLTNRSKTVISLRTCQRTVNLSDSNWIPTVNETLLNMKLCNILLQMSPCKNNSHPQLDGALNIQMDNLCEIVAWRSLNIDHQPLVVVHEVIVQMELNNVALLMEFCVTCGAEITLVHQNCDYYRLLAVESVKCQWQLPVAPPSALELSKANFEGKQHVDDSQVIGNNGLVTNGLNGSGDGNTRSGQKSRPNILVYADSAVTRDKVRALLGTVLDPNGYVIYDLPVADRHGSWYNSTALVVICGTVPPTLAPTLIEYYVTGGQLLCLCSDLIYSVLHMFTTAEVREHELVHFTYGTWQRTKLMHHIFCYQPSPAKKQFSRDLSAEPDISHAPHPTTAETTTPTNTTLMGRSSVQLNHAHRNYTLQVRVLGTEDVWHTPSLLLATVLAEGVGNGAQPPARAIFSQIHFEIEPDDYYSSDDSDVLFARYETLKVNNPMRLAIFKDLLETHLGLRTISDSDITDSCQQQLLKTIAEDSESLQSVIYTPAYFLGRYETKITLLQTCAAITHDAKQVANGDASGELKLSKMTLTFYPINYDPGEVTPTRLPVLMNACPAHFSTYDYFDALRTHSIGRLVIYSDVMTSTHAILDGGATHTPLQLEHGLCVIARRQTHGIGRAHNTWLSPEGGAWFSMQLHCTAGGGILSRATPIAQHLVATAIVDTIQTEWRPRASVQLKWPNDIYVNGAHKIGGLLAHAHHTADGTIVINVGCGLNLANPAPTTCLQQYVDTPLKLERYFAAIFNRIETLYEEVSRATNLDDFRALYYRYWMHDRARVRIVMEGGDGEGVAKEALIRGIDDYGYLRASLLAEQNGSGGEEVTLHPDDNSFDMMKGLIAPKRQRHI